MCEIVRALAVGGISDAMVSEGGGLFAGLCVTTGNVYFTKRGGLRVGVDEVTLEFVWSMCPHTLTPHGSPAQRRDRRFHSGAGP